MKKNMIKLTEKDLHKIVKESVNRILKEEEDNYYGGGLPDSAYQDPGNESPNEVDDFDGTPKWKAIDDVMGRNGINDIDFNMIQPLIKPLAQRLQTLDKAMEEAVREGNLVHEDVIKYMRETMPNYVNLLFKVRHLWQHFGWLVGRK